MIWQQRRLRNTRRVVAGRFDALRDKKILLGKKYWSVRAGLDYRAVGVEVDDGISWFWIGTHAEYDKLIYQLD
jgi:hypothetical protein